MVSVVHDAVSDATPDAGSRPRKERLVVLGSGWGASVLLQQLDLQLYNVSVVTPDTSRTYTPMLASVATGNLTLFATMEATKRPGLTVYAAKAQNIDVKGKKVACRPVAEEQADFSLDYDVLVVAIGCAVQDFGTPGVAEHALFFKTVQDALAVRNRIIRCFEAAALPHVNEAEKRRLLHFCIVGGGATGIELAAELSDLLKSDLHKLYSDLTPLAQISIYDVAPAILPGFDHDLTSYATNFFKREAVNIETEKHIEKVEAHAMHVKEQGKVDFGMLVWSTGLAPVPLLKKGIKGTKQDDKTRNLIVNDFLQVLDQKDNALPDVYACGDLSGKLPPVGAVADQQGQYVARSLALRAAGKEQRGTFRFTESRKVSYLGSQRSVQQKGDSGKTAGRGAWALWREEYARTLSYKRRLILGLYWLITSLFGRDLVRI